MVSVKTLLITSTVCLAVGLGGGAAIYAWFDHQSIAGGVVPTNAAAVAARVEERLRTVYVPVSGDTTKYTNLYSDCSDLSEQVGVLTNRIIELAHYGDRIRLLLGVTYINRPGIPLGASGGIEWGTLALIGTVGLQTNFLPDIASVTLLWRF